MLARPEVRVSNELGTDMDRAEQVGRCWRRWVVENEAACGTWCETNAAAAIASIIIDIIVVITIALSPQGRALPSEVWCRYW